MAEVVMSDILINLKPNNLLHNISKCFIFYIGQTVFHNQYLVILCKCCSVKTCLYWEWCSGYLLRSPFFLLWSFYNSSLTILPVCQVESVSVSLLYPVQSMNPINFTPYRIKFFYPQHRIKLLNHDHRLFLLRSVIVIIIFLHVCLHIILWWGRS